MSDSIYDDFRSILFFITCSIIIVIFAVKCFHTNIKSIPETKNSDKLTETEQLAYIISAECLQCDSIEKSLVGSVIINRIYDNNFPYTIQGVIEEDKQFHGLCGAQYMFDSTCYKIAVRLMKGCKRDIRVLYFYRNNMNKPNWVEKVLYRKEYHNFGI